MYFLDYVYLTCFKLTILSSKKAKRKKMHSNFYINIQCFPHIDFPIIINSHPSIFGNTFLFLLLLLSLTLFLYARDNETIRDRLTVGQSPLARTARSVCFRTVDTPRDNLQCFPYVRLFVAGCNNMNIHSVGRCLQSTRSDSPGVCSEQWAAEKQHFQLAAANSSSVSHLQNNISKHLSLSEGLDL